jgi:filamentous hemagglutinin family protein
MSPFNCAHGNHAPVLLHPLPVSLTAVAVAIGLLTATCSAQAADLPTGGTIVGGSGSIVTSGRTLTVTQSSQRLATDWQSFNIGAGNTVNFVQPSAQAVALNRVLGPDVSVIQGALNANGQVFLVNPHGVLFTPTAQVNVGGIVASTLQLRKEDFMAGNYRFSGSSANAIVNRGHITATGDGAQGGSVALIAAKIRNEGSLTSQGGQVLLGAGSEVLLDLGSTVSLSVTQGALDTLIEQGGAIKADGGLVYLSAKSLNALTSTVIQHTGVTQAQTLVTGEQGQIYLMGGMAKDRIEVGGTLDASAPRGGSGGFVETSAAQLKIAPDMRVTTQASSGNTGRWLIDPTDFTITAGSSDQTTNSIGAATLQNALASSDVTIATSATDTTGQSGDIHVNSAVSWSANKLTLTAHRNINVNAVMTASGAASLDLNTGGAGNGGEVNMAMGATDFTGRIDFGGSGALRINTNSYSVIQDAAGLQGINSAGLSGYYALGSDVSLSGIANFVPIGSVSSLFTGRFNGLGHRVTNLNINQSSSSSYVGLFAHVSSSAQIENVNLVNGSVSGGSYTGSLAGRSMGTIRNVLTGVNVTGQDKVGGLVGANDAANGGVTTGKTASISNSHASGNVVGALSYVGGLVGRNAAGSGASSGTAAGGNASVQDSSATGSVTSSGLGTGGLIGLSQNGYRGYTFDNMDDQIYGGDGGLAIVSRSFATGAIRSIYQRAGGLVGENYGTISQSFSTSNLTANHAAGGLVGVNWDSGSISDSYARGSVSGNSAEIGGLVGNSFGSITRSYATGAVTGSATVKGGLIGYYGRGSVTSSYWDTQTSGLSTSAGGVGTGLTTDQMKQQGSLSRFDFISASPIWGLQSAANGGYPVLCTFGSCAPPVINVYIKPSSGTSVYGNAPEFSYALVDSAGSLYSLSNTSVTGTAIYSGAPTASSNVGLYSFTYGSGLSLTGTGASGYSLTPWATTTSWTVTKAALTVSANNANKYYGDTNPSLSATISGFVNGQTQGTAGISGGASLSTTATNQTGVGSTSIVAGQGTLAATNYDFTTFHNGALTINRRPITVTVDAGSKTYGSADPLLTYQLDGGNLIGSDVLGGALKRKAGETVGSYSIDASGLSHGNYQITARNGVFTVMPQPAYSLAPVPVIQPESVVSSSPTSSLLVIPAVIFESQEQSLANPQSAR